MMSDAVIESLNLWGDHCARIAWPLLWQSSLLIVGVFIADIFLRRKLRPSVRQALWFVVLVKLLLPPSFAIPTGIGWWLRPREVAPAKPQPTSYIVTYGSFHAPGISRPEEAPSSIIPVLPPVRLSASASALLASAGISATLLVVMLLRWRHLRRQLRRSESPPTWLQEIAGDARSRARCRRPVSLTLTDATISPALCGLFKPVILLPKALVNKLTPPQLRAVLLHELFHLRNGDVWINCFQSLLQIVFWWHPFLWLANARIRRIREEVVDDSVRLVLAEEAETYAPTLLEVARLALARPLATLGLVGILESRHALKQRVDRLVNFPAPKRVGLSIISGLSILAFASAALPMGQAPPKNVTPTHREAPTIYYKFDQTFLDYFGSNGVDAVIQKLAQSNRGSKFLRDSDDTSVSQSESEHFNSQPGTLNSNTGNSPVDIANSTWEFRPLTEIGSVDYDFATGIGTATNGAVVTYGGTTISADKITVNQQTREVFASGSVKIQTGSNPPVEIESGNIKYDAAMGTVTATKNPVLRQGDRVIKADNITFDSQGTNAIVNGHYDSKVASGNTTLELAQVQPTLSSPIRTIHTSSGKRGIFNKLNAIRLDHVAFDNLPLSEVVNNLRDEAKKRDPEGKGINFLINPNADLAGAAGPPAIDPATGLQVPPSQGEPADINGVAIRIMPPLEDVRMIDVLDAITKVADKRIRYSIEDYGVSFWLAGNTTPAPLFTRVIKVDPNVFAQGLESVVGFSVGNFQTGGQGGGGQGNSSGVSVPRVQVAPNIGGQGGQAGAGGAQGSGGISGVTRPTAMTTQQAVRQLFANAGVDLSPPKNVFFNDRAGTVLVHATLNDLDIIEKAVMTLNAGSVLPSTSSARPPTASVTETPSGSVSPQTKVPKAPVLGDLPAVGKALTGTIEVSAENSPQQIPNANASNTEKLLTETMGVDPITFSEWVKKTAGLGDNANSQEKMDAFRKILLDRGLRLAPPANVIYNGRSGVLFVRAIRSEMDVIAQIVQELNRSSAKNSAQANRSNPVTDAANAGTDAKLLTRTMIVNPDTFREGIRTIVPLPDNASPQETMGAFHKFVLISGVRLEPPANMFYNERNGSLFVRAIAPEMDAIEQMVQQLNYVPPQVNIKAKFVEVSGDSTNLIDGINLIPINSDTNGSALAILTDPQFRAVLHALEQREGADMMSESSVTTLSGRQAQVQNVDTQSIVKLNPQALISPGVASSNVYVTEPLYSGPVLDIVPFASESGDKIQLTITATVTEFVGYDPPESGEAPIYVDGKATKLTRPHPRTHVRTMQSAAILHDGQTVMLGRPKDEMITVDKDGKAVAAPSTSKKNLLVFVTATLIDAAGNPVHSLDSPSSPPQR